MEFQLEGKPSFAYIHVDLAPGETFIAESDAMASMSSDLDIKAKLNGGLFRGLMRKFLGGESLFINEFSNNGSESMTLTLTQGTPGDIVQKELTGESYFLQPGAYICSTADIKVSIQWAGFMSWIGGEGLFRLKISGTGTVFFGAYGCLLEKEIDGEYIVDTSHLVAYEPNMKLKQQLSGSLISSLTSGEGLVTRVEGKGKIIIQTRSISGLTSWLNRYLY
jgi:uncharacterized protein (TIGR00266 family)|tara:strand:- start:5232 stop:5894 length:663 start_codon:yes stop_codon:yes gene_type:complete